MLSFCTCTLNDPTVVSHLLTREKFWPVFNPELSNFPPNRPKRKPIPNLLKSIFEEF